MPSLLQFLPHLIFIVTSEVCIIIPGLLIQEVTADFVMVRLTREEIPVMLLEAHRDVAAE